MSFLFRSGLSASERCDATRGSLHLRGLWAERLSAITWISLLRGWLIMMSVRRATNSAELSRAAVLPSTSPVLVLKATHSDSVPCR